MSIQYSRSAGFEVIWSSMSFSSVEDHITSLMLTVHGRHLGTEMFTYLSFVSRESYAEVSMLHIPVRAGSNSGV